MSTLEQVKENVKSADKSAINILSKTDLNLIEKASERMRGPITCTRCGYCMPCPNGVNIPENFLLFNNAHLYDAKQENKEKYLKLEEEKRASACVECGQCEPACPQHLPIIKLLKDTAQYFSV